MSKYLSNFLFTLFNIQSVQSPLNDQSVTNHYPICIYIWKIFCKNILKDFGKNMFFLNCSLRLVSVLVLPDQAELKTGVRSKQQVVGGSSTRKPRTLPRARSGYVSFHAGHLCFRVGTRGPIFRHAGYFGLTTLIFMSSERIQISKQQSHKKV